MDEDKLFENEFELLELSFRAVKPQKVKNDWDHWDEADSAWYEDYMRKRKLEEMKRKDDLNK